MIETHISQVFLYPHDVYKIKKPVALGFLDFSTLALRRAACEAELELNRRLAPDVYLELVPVTRDAAGRHHLAGDGETVDWAVHMRRLNDDDRADLRLEAGRLGLLELRRVARRLAQFHAGARVDAETTRFGDLAVIRANVCENFAQTRETVGRYLDPEHAQEIERWQLEFLDHHADLFADRQRNGRVRDGHGDLRLEHLYLTEEQPASSTTEPAVRILDCIEFNTRFRFADIAADIAFLSMDLAARGRVDLAEGFLAAYALEANDYDLFPLIDFYEAYRAHVRAKIASFVAASADDERTREAMASDARRYYLLALASQRRSLLSPALIAVGGLIAAGKTTFADRLSARLSAPVIEADRTRKHLLGVDPETRLHHGLWQGAYAPEVTQRVYHEVFRRADLVLQSGRPVILDASFRSTHLRLEARELARRLGVPFLFVECQAPIEILRRRLEERARNPATSDGREAIAPDFAASWENATELSSAERMIVATEQPFEDLIAALRARLPLWPSGLTG